MRLWKSRTRNSHGRPQCPNHARNGQTRKLATLLCSCPRASPIYKDGDAGKRKVVYRVKCEIESRRFNEPFPRYDAAPQHQLD